MPAIDQRQVPTQRYTAPRNRATVVETSPRLSPETARQLTMAWLASDQARPDPDEDTVPMATAYEDPESTR